MKRSTILLLSLLLFVFACSSHEKENTQFKEELKMLREENDYLKAEIVGLKRELAELRNRVKEEKESLQKKIEDERAQLHKRFQEERELMQKRIQEAGKKKSGTVSKELTVKDAGTAKKDAKETGSKIGKPGPGDVQAPAARELPARAR